MNQAVTTPANSTPASCPLLAAVLPLRYAVGPDAELDAQLYGLPALSGKFPVLGAQHPDISFMPLGYMPRLLRDGWLYLWQPSLNQLSEHRVVKAAISETNRGGKPLDTSSKPYLLMSAGTPAMLVWSPSQWSDEQFLAAKTKVNVRQRIMRNFTPGAAPFSGQAKSIHEKIGDYMHSESFKWSCAPDTRHRPYWPKLLGNMQRCEQQSYLVIDDAWGVLVDLAGLVRARQEGFTARRAERADDWATAGMLKSLSESDKQLKGELPGITRYRQLVATWQEQESEQATYEDDLRRLATHWADWLASMADLGPASLDTACGHFDINQPIARSGLEASFAAACLGPSATSLGAKAIEQALTPGGQAGSPWLLWTLLGVGKRLSPGEIKLLLHVVESSADAMPDTAALARAIALSLALNQSVEKLLAHKPAQAMEAFSAAVAPAVGGGLNRLMQQADDASMLYLVSALARSNQRITVDQASAREVGLWVSRVMGSEPLTTKSVPALNSPLLLRG